MSKFRPPVTPPPAQPLRFTQFLRATRQNALGIFSRGAYDEWSMTGKQFGRVTVLLNAPDAIQHVLVANAANYRRTPTSLRILSPIVGNGLLLSEGEDWRFQRRTIAPALAPRVLPVLSAHIVRAARDAIAALAPRADGTYDLLHAMQHMALDIAARSMFSMEMKRHAPMLRGYLTRYGETLARPHILDLFLPASVSSPHDVLRARFRRAWMRFLDELVGARLAEPPSDPPRDLLDLLRAARDPETGEGFTREALCEQTATMIVAGHETTAITLFWALYVLANDADAQERVAAEANAVALVPETAYADQAKSLPFTRAVVSEALRLFPPAFTLVRSAIADDVADGTPIPPKAAVMISPWVLHRHRKLWDDPDAFDPGRFMGPPPPRFSYLPFGAGPRVCVGMQFALAEATIALALLVRAFDVRMADARPAMPVPVITTVPDHAPRFTLRARAGALARAA